MSRAPVRFTAVLLASLVAGVALVTCDTQDPTMLPTATSPQASVAASEEVPARLYWQAVSADSLWRYIVRTDTTVTVGVKKPGQRRGYFRGQRLVDASTWTGVLNALHSLGEIEVQEVDSDLPVVRVKVRSVDALERAQRLPFIDYIEPAVLLGSLNSGGCDPNYGSENLNGDSVPEIFWGMRIPAVWHYSTGAGKTIAMIDVGVFWGNPDLADWIPVSIANEDPFGNHSHGTHQAGAIGAARDSNIVVGAAYGAEKISIRHGQEYGCFPNPLGPCGLPPFYDVNTWRLRDALDSAYNRGADVVSMSLSADDGSNQVSDKIDQGYIAPLDVLFFAAAGSAADAPFYQSVVFPANHPRVVAVAAVDYNDDLRSECSHYGPEVELSAYHGMTTTGHFTEGYYGVTSNTSNATSIVAAVATLVRAKYPSYSNEQVRQLLRATARDVSDPGPDHMTGYGVIDAYAAIGGPEWQVTVYGPSVVSPGVECTFTVGGLAGVAPYDIRWYAAWGFDDYQYVGSGPMLTRSWNHTPMYLKAVVTDAILYRSMDAMRIDVSEEAPFCPIMS